MQGEMFNRQWKAKYLAGVASHRPCCSTLALVSIKYTRMSRG